MRFPLGDPSLSDVAFEPADLRGVLNQAVVLVEEASRVENLDLRRKLDGSPITAVDRQINGFLRGALGRLVPDSSWLSEEDDPDPERLAAEYCWVVDPLDGTTDFLAGRAECAISVALVTDGTPVAAAIVNPLTGEGASWVLSHETIFWGWAPRSTTNSATRLIDARVVISRGEIERGSGCIVAERLPNVSAVGSAAYKLLRVAAGVDDLYVSLEPKSEWDVCAGVALLNAEGMTYRLLSGHPMYFNQRDTRVRSGAVGGAELLVEAFLRELGPDLPSVGA